ncbi:MAG: hypothetical protein WC315_00085 [Candidatus Omnitrophota bacterium]|jgi:hypothetical protein
MKKTLIRYGVPLAAFWTGGMATILIDVHSKIGELPLDLVYQVAKWPYYAVLYLFGG